MKVTGDDQYPHTTHSHPRKITWRHDSTEIGQRIVTEDQLSTETTHPRMVTGGLGSTETCTRPLRPTHDKTSIKIPLRKVFGVQDLNDYRKSGFPINTPPEWHAKTFHTTTTNQSRRYSAPGRNVHNYSLKNGRLTNLQGRETAYAFLGHYV